MNRLLTAAVLLTAFLLSIPAHADDIKVYQGSDCKVFGATAWTDLSFSGFGVKNLADSARNIICPIIKDSEGFWDGEAVMTVNAGRLFLRIQTGSVAASYACTVYVTTLTDTSSVNSYAMSSGGVKSAYTITSHLSGYFNSTATSGDGGYDKAYMLCTLGPQVRLLGYQVREPGDTDVALN